MLHLAKLSIRRPRAALAVWAVIAVTLSLIGLGVSHSLSPSIVVVPGSEASRAQKLTEGEFGPSVLVPILLEGPAAQLERQGPKVVLALDTVQEQIEGTVEDTVSGDVKASITGQPTLDRALRDESIATRPVLLPAAVALLGRRVWWPTREPSVKPAPAKPLTTSTPGVQS